MKKLILAVAILAGGVSTFALSSNILPTETIDIVMNEEFKEIPVDKLPTAITNAVKKNFASAKISKAYVNSNQQYKLVLSIDGSAKIIYTDKEGNWLKESAIKKGTKKK